MGWLGRGSGESEPKKGTDRTIVGCVACPHRQKNAFVERSSRKVFRVGYYSRKDGLDCIWLVNDEVEYEQPTDHEYRFKFFDVIQFAEHTNWYGRTRESPQFGALIGERRSCKLPR